MAETPDLAALVEGIEAHDADAVSTLATLPDRCLADARNRTLFDVAILANNSEAIALLASDKKALEFAAAIDPGQKDPIRHSAAMHDIKYPISKLEAVLEKSFGQDLAYGRTPLQTACRVGNVVATDALLAAGAKANAKDAIGLTAVELAFYARGEEGLQNLIVAAEKNKQTNLPVGKRLLRELFAFPETLEKLLAVAKLDAYARRFLFCYRCAWLDTEAVRAMLADGYDPNKGLSADINPLWEACTSALLWDEAIPDGFEQAFHFTKHWGHPGASSVSFDNALLNEDGSNFGQLFAEAQKKQRAQIKIVDDMSISPESEQDLIERRVAMLDVLLGAGADARLARDKLSFGSFSELKEMGLGDVAQRLKGRRDKAARPAKKLKPKTSTFWELAGETGLNVEYWPEEGHGGLIRMILHNVYGPVDGMSLSVQLTEKNVDPEGEWTELNTVKETVDVDGEILTRAELTEPVYGEAPWEAHYELPLDEAGAANRLWIRLSHEDESLSGELDPWDFVSGR